MLDWFFLFTGGGLYFFVFFVKLFFCLSVAVGGRGKHMCVFCCLKRFKQLVFYINVIYLDDLVFDAG